MKSMKQKDQAHGYVRDAVIRTILGHYKTKLEDLSMEELEAELYAEEETTKFGEIPFDGSALLSFGLEQAIKSGEVLYQEAGHEVTPRPSEEEIKVASEKLIEQARSEGFVITPKVSESDQRKVSKWQRHENYSKRKSRDMPRHQQNASEKEERFKRFSEQAEADVNAYNLASKKQTETLTPSIPKESIPKESNSRETITALEDYCNSSKSGLR